MLDYRIHTFLSLCETRSYTKTAQILHISQPSVTQHIKALERYYNCRLFQHEGRNLELTEEGKYLYQKEINILTNEKEIETHIEQMRKGTHLRIGMTPSVCESFVPKNIAVYVQQHPSTHFQFVIEDMKQLREYLANGTLDVVFSEDFFLNASIFERHIYHQEQLILVSDPDTAANLYGKPVTSILKETLLIPPENSGLREIIMHWLNARSIALNDFYKVIEVNSMTMVREMLAQKVGVSILFESTVQQDVQSRRLQRLHMDDFFLWGKFQFVYLKESLSKEIYLRFLHEFQNIAMEQGHTPAVPTSFPVR
ncbi:MAG: LysR family transcriptional regulator [Oscillospiraceae bacterium]|nr:LysR family transcriptional regulator [Oscillospiraceae bacterium]MDD7294366.1 LysR family transcriptional regulator [Oscillospiraceae bacterium]MDY2509393.1 LysR family transcriptional regulator [Ruminococcus callidus]